MYLPTLAIPSRRLSRAHPRPARHGVVHGVLPMEADDDSGDDADLSYGDEEETGLGDYSASDDGDE